MKIEMEPYHFQNIYLITTYRCNWNCPFCLFKFNKERECSVRGMLERLEYAILDSKKKVYIKITGGEPFLRPKLLKGIFEVASRRKYRVHAVGIGTNGSIHLPAWFQDVDVPTNIFLSRHEIADDLPTASQLRGNIDNPNIHFRLNCNLIRGHVDTLRKIELYILYRIKHSIIESVCFRELSKVSLDRNSMYPPQIYDYEEYYKKNIVPIQDIIDTVNMTEKPIFQWSRIRGNAYDRNYWAWYTIIYGNGPKKISVKFRQIDEAQLIQYNMENEGIDEYVIHPDGTLTGCWDKDIKIIKRGGPYYAK